MPFENFYKEADKHAHRLRLCVISAVFFIAAYFGLPFFVSWLLTPAPAVENAPVATEAQRREADELCLNLPKPELFSLASVEEKKTANGAATIVYTYTSARGIDEVMPHFLIWFEKEGWQKFSDEVYRRENNVDRVFNFRNGSRRISVMYFNWQETPHSVRQTRYEIACTVEKR